MKNEPQKVIVYRSTAEQRQDEYLYGEGIFSPTGATDIVIIVIIAAAIMLLYSFYKKRR